MKTITKKVISWCSIPENITKGHWLSEFQNGCYIPFTLEDKGVDELSDTIRETYPEIKEDEEFLIDIDY